jgi:hypothetical protein
MELKWEVGKRYLLRRYLLDTAVSGKVIELSADGDYVRIRLDGGIIDWKKAAEWNIICILADEDPAEKICPPKKDSQVIVCPTHPVFPYPVNLPRTEPPYKWDESPYDIPKPLPKRDRWICENPECKATTISTTKSKK